MKPDQPEFSYKTQHADIILWQYCYGLFDMIPRIEESDRVKAFELNEAAKRAQIRAIYDIDPSFRVILEISRDGDKTMFDMKKVPVES